MAKILFSDEQPNSIINTVLLDKDNPTNGDVIKALFPDAENIRVDNGLPLNFVLEFELHRNYRDWWNAPYKAGDTKEHDCEHCSRTYGTLGCCSTVSNKWVYSCEEGNREYEETHKETEDGNS